MLAADRQLDRAWNDKDVDALDHLWADDYLFIGWTGEIMDKPERMAAIRSGKFQVQSVQSDEVKVRALNELLSATQNISDLTTLGFGIVC